MHHLYIISFSVTLFSALFSLFIFKKSSLTLVSIAKHLLILMVLGFISFNEVSQVFLIPKYSLISINITLFFLNIFNNKVHTKADKIINKTLRYFIGLSIRSCYGSRLRFKPYSKFNHYSNYLWAFIYKILPNTIY